MAEGFIYAADVWCEDCGERISADLKARGLAPENPDNEHTYDSSDYPKIADPRDESDCIHHCAAGEDCISAETLADGSRVGQFFANELTTDGVNELRRLIADDSHSPAVWLWSDYYSEGYADIPRALPRVKLTRDARQLLRNVADAPGDIGLRSATTDKLIEDGIPETSAARVAQMWADGYSAMPEEFFNDYLWSALFSSNDYRDPKQGMEPYPLDDDYDIDDFDPQAEATLREECERFWDHNWNLIDADPGQAGHDFWMTRNHHGAGFWDGDWTQFGDALTESAREFCEVSLFADGPRVNCDHCC